jgi:glycosyltransferase involved in cell wall biosynthesis
MREYYDRWDDWSHRLSPQGRLKETARRTLIRAADTYCFKYQVRKLFAQSAAVRDRLARWNRVAAEVLHPPPPQRAYRCDGYGDYLFVASRLTPLKRVGLVLEALARPPARGVKCVIAGEGEERAALEARARALDLEPRVTFAGHVTEDELVGHLARCRAVVFPPVEEDYGFVTVEAFAARKPVITCTDSGGPVELVRHGENGLVVAPTAETMADACAQLMGSQDLAERMGGRAHATVAPMTWAAAVEKLVIV